MIILNTKQLENLEIRDDNREKIRSKIKETISKLDEDADLVILSNVLRDPFIPYNTTDCYKVMDFVKLIYSVYLYDSKPGSISRLLVFYLANKLRFKEMTMKEAFIRYDNIYTKYGEDICKIDNIIMSKLIEPNLTLMILIEQKPNDMSFAKTTMRLSDKKFDDHYAELLSNIGEIIDTL